MNSTTCFLTLVPCVRADGNTSFKHVSSPVNHRQHNVLSPRRICHSATKTLLPSHISTTTTTSVTTPLPDVAATTETETGTSSSDDQSAFPLQCPNCKAVLPSAAPPLTETAVMECPECSTRFPRRNDYLDMTASKNSFFLLSPFAPLRQALFETPAVAFAYERGWRRNFAMAGFPGPDMEADLALDYLLPARELLDVSCGTGILTRRLVAAAPVDCRVVAVDVSHPMLLEAGTRLRNDVRLPPVDLVRADVANLPFARGAFDVVHAGAALHCWPVLQDGLKEIERVLKPGGRFFATTFLNGAYWNRTASLRPVVDVIRRANLRAMPQFRFFEVDELNFLFRAAGFENVQVEQRKECAIIRCSKRDDAN